MCVCVCLKYFVHSDFVQIVCFIMMVNCGIMHQSLVTTVHPPTEKGRDYDFSASSALL